MATNIQCEHCGQQMAVEADAGVAVVCPKCGGQILVPENQETHAEYNPRHDSKSRQAMNKIMPWVFSLLFHLGLALVLVIIPMIVIQNTIPEDVIFPDAIWSENPGGQMTPSESQSESTSSSQTTQRRSELQSSITQSTSSQTRTVLASGGGTPSGGSLALVGPGLSGSSGPQSSFLGTRGGNVYNVVYVIDRSGSMLQVFRVLRFELAASIDRLRDFQNFQVILFNDGPYVAFNHAASGYGQEGRAARLYPGDVRYKEQVAMFLRDTRPMNVTSTATTDPIPAIRVAFTLLQRTPPSQPGRLIYLLTDGDFRDNQAVLETIRGLNNNGTVYINTFLYAYERGSAEQLLEQIAEENGGQYEYVNPSDY